MLIIASVGLTTMGPYSSLDKCNEVAEGINVIMGERARINAVCIEVK